jgi:hypothetical protein
MTDIGSIWRPHAAAFPARIGVVDVALEALGVEAHRERTAAPAAQQRGQSRSGVPKTPKSGAGLERNHLPLSAEITCRFRPKSGAGLLRFLRLELARKFRAREHFGVLTAARST